MAAKIIVVIFGFAGFALANYIRGTKQKSVPLMCPFEGSCEAVIRSRYSKLFGIPLEHLGMFYYGIVALAYLAFAFVPQALPTPVLYFILALTVAAFLFSLYLTAVQALLLRHWCTWCLLSAGICTVIFSLVMFISELSITELSRSILLPFS